MADSGASTIAALCIAGGLLFGVPLVTLSDRVDNVSQQDIQLILDEFVTETANTGKLTKSQYQDLENRIESTGNTYEIELEIWHIDENPGKKTTQANYKKVGENVYWIEYTTQVLPQIGIRTTDNDIISSNDSITLNEGDIVVAKAKNADSTQAMTLKSSFLGYTNAGEYVIEASSSKMCTVNGGE